uniref:Uncharacterized protein n=1 Tax=Chromera velia CCMP2878 TaxID=1169474 RepID=A0A0G4HHY0_9ALVE|eukprot:Cvel_27747.t1-p1 / transcript=Cvel_27747.t1 / gene=Cvel_27747 / organism=Chromera_velia_CCMP2878 / gene_product=UPF0301 protein Cpha266_0885, putative / transcript_product=UPF0301 protein Cpha266_0885, putative / location=Cvel_scaffold3516:4442-9892(-) / protein_length=471 / sequence_SO=supercontig / SO=protein_coding / is_pseudo=false
MGRGSLGGFALVVLQAFVPPQEGVAFLSHGRGGEGKPSLSLGTLNRHAALSPQRKTKLRDSETSLVSDDWRARRAKLLEQGLEYGSQPAGLDSSRKSREGPLEIEWVHELRYLENGALLLGRSDFPRQAYFRHSVILITDHHPDLGDRGVIINAPLPMPLGGSVAGKGSVSIADCPLYSGGDCGRDLSVLHRCREVSEGDTEVLPGWWFKRPVENDFKKIDFLIQNGVAIPEDFKFFRGDCGWNEGQLAEEVRQNYWVLIAADESVVTADLFAMQKGGRPRTAPGGVAQRRGPVRGEAEPAEKEGTGGGKEGSGNSDNATAEGSQASSLSSGGGEGGAPGMGPTVGPFGFFGPFLNFIKEKQEQQRLSDNNRSSSGRGGPNLEGERFQVARGPAMAMEWVWRQLLSELGRRDDRYEGFLEEWDDVMAAKYGGGGGFGYGYGGGFPEGGLEGEGEGDDGWDAEGGAGGGSFL